MSRALSAKAALGVRVDALGDDVTSELGVEHRAKMEARIRALEGGNTYKVSGTGKRASAKFDKYENKSQIIQQHKAAGDNTMGNKRKFGADDDEAEEKTPKKVKVEGETDLGSEKKKKKKKKNKEEEEEEAAAEAPEEPTSEKKKKKKRKSGVDEDDAAAGPAPEGNGVASEKKKKKRKSEANGSANEV